MNVAFEGQWRDADDPNDITTVSTIEYSGRSDACIVMAYIVMAYIVIMAYIAMASVAMAYVVMVEYSGRSVALIVTTKRETFVEPSSVWPK